ncbi:glycosyltransferase [Methylorubrum salsuginis]|uniref:Glycosyltransferase involved in cell wall bisynthesis n=1 Tax=Methylorubrum salsuginis TaxID=414703 RepID=A0A1I4LPD1_9HYPH|nr:glycosyltransferase [Methylorubrum salsuginis]SFL92882.1 Glycosyltransferase involved in cell wall bisynthesis [Methylorubrum salsuginis]
MITPLAAANDPACGSPCPAIVPDSVLLVTAVPLKRIGSAICLDDQTCDGLERWGEHFARITYAGIETPPGPAGPTGSSTTWRPVRDLRCADRLTMVSLPDAYRIKAFSKHYAATRATLAHQIGRSRYLCFTLGALIGDWGGVAALEAIARRRDYAVWFDRVESEVIRRTLKVERLRRRIKERVSLPLMERYHRYLIRRSTLGLFQGQDCFQTYAPHATKPFCVYDTHTTCADRIPMMELQGKRAAILRGEPIRLLYVGRASAMKGPFDWLDAVAGARRAGLHVSATWLGDGPLLEAMRARVRAEGLETCVSLPGFEGDRGRLLRAMREAHLFLFCHTTPESPRCLVEALVCGTPLVGYGSPYSEGLVGREGAGLLSTMGDAVTLVRSLVELDRDRERLAGLTDAAARTGQQFDAETVYGERAALIKHFL